MAYELHGLLAGNVSIVTGENIKPSYGGDDESFLRKVITPLYRVIDKVTDIYNVQSFYCCSIFPYLSACNDIPGSPEEQKWEGTLLCLVQLWWPERVFLVSNNITEYTSISALALNFHIFDIQFSSLIPRSSDCFSLGWPMRDDGEFFKSTRETVKVTCSVTIMLARDQSWPSSHVWRFSG